VSRRGQGDGNLEDIRTVTYWPGSYGDAVPSRIAYCEGGIEWGYEAKATSTTYCWMKMLLDEPPEMMADQAADMKLPDGDGWMSTPPGKSPQTIIRDFLAQVNKAVMSDIKASYGEHLIKVLPTRCWFTVPAHWPLSARVDLRDAARSAGFGTFGDPVFLMAEAEASLICGVSEAAQSTDNIILHRHAVASDPGDAGSTSRKGADWSPKSIVRVS
jgi:hypothetical protein